MKVSVLKDELQKKLSNIQNIVDKRNTMPILTHFLLDAAKQGSHIIATDLETALKEPLQITVEKEGKICIPARKMFEIVREVEGEIYIELIGEQWINVKAGASNFKLACLSISEFPAWPAMEDVEEITLDAGVILNMIEKTIYSAGESDTRYTLNGLLFHANPTDSTFTVVGTDGHRLAVIVQPLEATVTGEKKMIIPRKSASELRRFLEGEEKVKLLLGKNHVLFIIGDNQFLTRLIEGTYPNYNQVIPKGNEKKVIIKREAFIKTLRRVSVMSMERSNAIKFDLKEDIVDISSSNPDLGEARDEIAVEYKGDAVSNGFNAKYLLDAINSMDAESVIMEMQDPLSPVLLREDESDSYRCVIMPMRI